MAQQEVVSVGSANRPSQPKGGAAGSGFCWQCQQTQPAERWRSRKWFLLAVPTDPASRKVAQQEVMTLDGDI